MKVLKNAKSKSRCAASTVISTNYNGESWFAVPTKEEGLYHVSTQFWGFRGYYTRESLKGIFGEV